jgi:ribosomal protein L37AE/L43A
MFNILNSFMFFGLMAKGDKILMDAEGKKCPLCGSDDLKSLPSGNFRCLDCGNSFIAGKKS